MGKDNYFDLTGWLPWNTLRPVRPYYPEKEHTCVT